MYRKIIEKDLKRLDLQELNDLFCLMDKKKEEEKITIEAIYKQNRENIQNEIIERTSKIVFEDNIFFNQPKNKVLSWEFIYYSFRDYVSALFLANNNILMPIDEDEGFIEFKLYPFEKNREKCTTIEKEIFDIAKKLKKEEREYNLNIKVEKQLIAKNKYIPSSKISYKIYYNDSLSFEKNIENVRLSFRLDNIIL